MYEGEFREDKPNGHGKLYYQDGRVYEGEFKNDAIEGEGIEYEPNGDKFVGVFKQNERYEGKIIKADGTEEFFKAPVVEKFEN